MKLMLLTIVCPPDLFISEYAIKSMIPALSDSINLTVFFNGVSPSDQDLIKMKIDCGYINYVSNYDRINNEINTISDQVGKYYKTETGALEKREGLYENGGAIWSRELIKFKEWDLVGIVDSDFEVFEPDFIPMIVNEFIVNPTLGFYSTDFGEDTQGYDSFSNQQAVFKKRYHTWFCIYRREALEKYPHFGYVEEKRDGLMHKWDHSAKLQEVLAESYGYVGACLEKRDRWKFIHYGAFAKNRSLNHDKLKKYRIMRIGKHNGFRHILRFRVFSKPVRIIFDKAYSLLGMSKFDKERKKYIYQA